MARGIAYLVAELSVEQKVEFFEEFIVFAGVDAALDHLEGNRESVYSVARWSLYADAV